MVPFLLELLLVHCWLLQLLVVQYEKNLLHLFLQVLVVQLEKKLLHFLLQEQDQGLLKGLMQEQEQELMQEQDQEQNMKNLLCWPLSVPTK